MRISITQSDYNLILEALEMLRLDYGESESVDVVDATLKLEDKLMRAANREAAKVLRRKQKLARGLNKRPLGNFGK